MDCEINCSYQEGVEALFNSLPRDLSNNPLQNLLNVLRYVQAWHRAQVPQSHRDALGELTVAKRIDFSSLGGEWKKDFFNVRTAYGDGIRIELQNEAILPISDVQFNDTQNLIFVESLSDGGDTRVIEIQFSAFKRDTYLRLKGILQD